VWKAFDDGGAQVRVADAEVPFESREDAEAWLGESWLGLTELGVVSVSLLCGGEVVYGPMSLEQE
ncbi:hypothetical protein, partial [Dermatophilus congolensis]